MGVDPALIFRHSDESNAMLHKRLGVGRSIKVSFGEHAYYCLSIIMFHMGRLFLSTDRGGSKARVHVCANTIVAEDVSISIPQCAKDTALSCGSGSG